MERTFSLLVPAGMTLRYAAAVAVLSLRRSRAVWLSILAVIAGAIWWAIIDFARNQSGWWLPFLLAAIAIVTMFVVVAAAVYRLELKSSKFAQGKVISSAVTPDMITFEWPTGSERIRPSDIDGISHALGFVMLTVSSRGVAMVVPARLLPANYPG
jgi:hypothetical protein